MKTRHIILFTVTVLVAGAAGWFAATWHARRTINQAASDKSPGRKVMYYQSAMHPWIKSDKPGRCTICGMELSPVYEGESGVDAGEGIVALGSNIIQVIHVQTEEVKPRRLVRSLRFAGTVDDDATKHRLVSAYVDGRIDQLFVNYVGAEVTAGEPLATFYSPMLLAAEREYVSLQKQSPRLSDSLEYKQMVNAAKSRLKQFGLTDPQIEALPRKNWDEIHTQILAPVSGTVVDRSVYEGQYVK